MENKFNFARFYEEMAKELGRIPDDDMGKVIAKYFGTWDKTIASTTRRDMLKKGYVITEVENGYLAELSKSPETLKLEKHMNELLAEVDLIRTKLSK